MMHIETVGKNLHTFFYAAEHNLSLTPSLYGDRIYTEGVWSKVLSIAYSILNLLGKEVDREERLKSIVSKTFNAFELEKAEILQFLNNFDDILGKDEEEVRLIKFEKIVQWNRWVVTSIEKLDDQIKQKVDSLYFSIIGEQQKIKLSYRKRNFSFMVKSVDFQIKTGKAFPYKAVAALPNDIINQKYQEEIKNLISALNNIFYQEKSCLLYDFSVHPNELHQLFFDTLSTVTLNKKHIENIPEKIIKLENQLTEKGLKIFTVPDKETLKALENLSGQHLENGIYILNHPIEKTLGKRVVYSLKNVEDRFCVFGFNEGDLSLSIENKTFKEKDPLIPFVLFEYIDENGKFAITQPVTPFKNYLWGDNEEKDKRKIKQVALLLKKFLDTKKVPKKYHLNDLFFNKEDNIVSLDTFETEEIKPNWVIDFIIDFFQSMAIKEQDFSKALFYRYDLMISMFFFILNSNKQFLNKAMKKKSQWSKQKITSKAKFQKVFAEMVKFVCDEYKLFA